MNDKTIFNGDEDGSKPTPTDRPNPELYDKGGFLPPGVTGMQRFLDGKFEPPEKPKPSLFGKVAARIAQTAILMVFVAGCIWLVAAIIANLPSR